MAVIAFAKWYFSRYVWLLTWVMAIFLVPLARIAIKWLLMKWGLWLRDTWIIGSRKNAYEAYKAITSERNLGLNVVGFVTDEQMQGEQRKTIDELPIIIGSIDWLNSKDKRTQFIVAVESEQSDIRNKWLREFMIKGYRYVSVIPTLRGMPLDSTDMSFILVMKL